MAESKAIVWDQQNEKLVEAGLDHGVFYQLSNGAYTNGVAWNGLTKVDEKPTGGEPNEIWADNILYASLSGTEKFEASIEAYMYPDAFAECDGSAEAAPGVRVGQQTRKPYGFSYRTLIGNDEKGTEYGYKIHCVYNAKVSPTDKSRETLTDSPDAASMSWDVKTTPVAVTGLKPTAHLEIDSTKCDEAKLKALEKVLYGDETTEPRMPLPDEIINMMKTTTSSNP